MGNERLKISVTPSYTNGTLPLSLRARAFNSCGGGATVWKESLTVSAGRSGQNMQRKGEHFFRCTQLFNIERERQRPGETCGESPRTRLIGHTTCHLARRSVNWQNLSHLVSMTTSERENSASQLCFESPREGFSHAA